MEVRTLQARPPSALTQLPAQSEVFRPPPLLGPPWLGRRSGGSASQASRSVLRQACARVELPIKLPRKQHAKASLPGRRGRKPKSALPGLFQLTPRLSALAATEVRQATQSYYLGCIQQLLPWLMVSSLPQWSPQQWDSVSEEYVAWLYDRDFPELEGSRTWAAVLWAEPTLTGPLKVAFPHAHRSLAGWRRLVPPSSRPPIPFAALMATALRLVVVGLPLQAV